MTSSASDIQRIPHRTCIGCRQRLPQAQLVRCTLGPNGAEASRTAAGRGAWLCSTECFATAVKKRAFARAWKCQVEAATLDALTIPFEAAIANMRELPSAGIHSDRPAPTKG